MMFYNDDRFRQDDIDINITNQNVNDNLNYNENYNMNMGGTGSVMGDVMSPIVEPGRERIINRTFVHEVPQE